MWYCNMCAATHLSIEYVLHFYIYRRGWFVWKRDGTWIPPVSEPCPSFPPYFAPGFRKILIKHSTKKVLYTILKLWNLSFFFSCHHLFHSMPLRMLLEAKLAQPGGEFQKGRKMSFALSSIWPPRRHCITSSTISKWNVIPYSSAPPPCFLYHTQTLRRVAAERRFYPIYIWYFLSF